MSHLKLSREFEFAMPTGELELLLADLLETAPAELRSRFRNWRLSPFPDWLASDTGNQLQYDLRRIVALTAALELASLSYPESIAIEMIVSCWPELCRAVLAASATSELASTSVDMPSPSGPLFTISCEAIGTEGRLLIDASAAWEFDLDALALRPVIVIDTRRIMSRLRTWAHLQGKGMVAALEHELSALQRDYGWHRAPVQHAEAWTASDLIGRSFLVDGPFFNRALEFFQSECSQFGVRQRPAARYRLQWLYDYLEDPAPIDTPKREIGRRSDQVRLRHFINFHARDLGLSVRERYPESWNLDDAKSSALSLLACLEK